MEKRKKITVTIAYDYPAERVCSDDRIAKKIRSTLERNMDPMHEKIETVTVKDI